MTAVRREHAGAAAATTLVAQLTAGATTFSITDATGWPTGAVGPFVVTIGAGTATEERILCLSRTTTTITVSSRGWESTADQLHAAGADVVHTFSATEADEANIAAVAVVGATGGLVGVTKSQTLTNKSVDLANNTVTGTKAQFDAAVSDGDFAYQSDLATLNAAWTAFTPTLSNFTATVTMARYKQIGKTVHYVIALTLTGAATGQMGFSLPAGIATEWDITLEPVIGTVVAVDISGPLYRTGVAIYDSTNNRGEVTSDTSGAAWNTLVPITWAAGDTLLINGTYEAA